MEVVDYQRDEVRDLTTGQVTGKTGLPVSNVLVFRMADGDRIVARPSGTEPKIKFYFMVCDCSRLPIASDAELKSRKAGLNKKHQTMREEFSERVNAIAGE